MLSIETGILTRGSNIFNFLIRSTGITHLRHKMHQSMKFAKVLSRNDINKLFGQADKLSCRSCFQC